MNLKRSAFRAALLTTALATVLGTGVGASFADTSGRHGIGSGNQVRVPVNAAVDVCGNAAGVLGRGLGLCPGGASVEKSGDGRFGHTSGKRGVLSGNQVGVPVNGAVELCGNGVAVLGRALGACEGSASVTGRHGAAGGRSYTDGRDSAASGNQAKVPVDAPIDACGNAVGNALAACDGGAAVRPHGMPDTVGMFERAAGDESGIELPVVGKVKVPVVGGGELPVVGDLTKNVGGLTRLPGGVPGLGS